MKHSPYPKHDAGRIPTRDHRIHPANSDMLLPVRRSLRRMTDVDYRAPDCICLITCCTRGKEPFFESSRRIRVVRDVLLEDWKSHRFNLLAYAIMPNHAHLILAPGDSGLAVGRIVGGWKSRVARHLWSMGVNRTPWQRDYDDRVLRVSERDGIGLQRMVAYVLENPVRKRLVRNWKDYPYSGCFMALDML